MIEEVTSPEKILSLLVTDVYQRAQDALHKTNGAHCSSPSMLLNRIPVPFPSSPAEILPRRIVTFSAVPANHKPEPPPDAFDGRLSIVGKQFLFLLNHATMEGMSKVGVLRGYQQEGAAGYFGPVLRCRECRKGFVGRYYLLGVVTTIMAVPPMSGKLWKGLRVAALSKQVNLLVKFWTIIGHESVLGGNLR